MEKKNVLEWKKLIFAVEARTSACIQAESRRKAVLAVDRAIAPLLKEVDIRVNKEFVEGWFEGKCVIVVSRDRGTIVEVKQLPGNLRQAEAMLAIGLQVIQKYREIRDECRSD